MAARSDAARRGQLCAALTALGLAGPALAAPAGADPEMRWQLEPPALAVTPERSRHLGRATLETAGLLLGGTIWYWRALDFNPGVVGARGYYYALGVTFGSRVDLEYRGWDLGLGVRADHFDSLAGFDRFRGPA